MKLDLISLNVTHMKESISFYEDILGLSARRTFTPMPGTEIAFLESEDGDTEIELIRNEKNSAPAYCNDFSIGFSVDSLEEFMAFLSSKSIPVHSGPFNPTPAVRFLYLRDPNGVRVQIIEHMSGD